MDQNTNPGGVAPLTPPPPKPNPQPAPQPNPGGYVPNPGPNGYDPRQWAAGAAQKQIDGFHRGYAATLKTVAYILIVLAAVAVLIAGFMMDDDWGPIVGILGGALTAFVFWFMLMYKVKMFDLTSKNAMANAAILEELKKLNEKK